MVIGGRDLTEPRLDPSGRWLAFVSRLGSSTAIMLVDLDAEEAVERVLVAQPPPAAGRGRGGGCFDWCPDGAAIVFAGRDGSLWHQPVPGGRVHRLVEGTVERPISAPTVAPTGAFVAFVVDQAEVWTIGLGADDGPGRRLDGGLHEFCLDPSFAPCGTTVAYQAWSPPDMPWDGAVVVTVDLPTGDRTVADLADGAWQQPGFAPDGAGVAVHDGDGLLQVRWGDRPVVPEERWEHAEPTWGAGQRSYAVSPDGERVGIARNEDGFGRLIAVDVASGTLESVARGVHGALSWSGDRLAALRSGARTPTQIVVYDTTTWQRRTIAVGPVAGWDSVDLVEPELVEATAADGATLHGRLYRPPNGDGRLLCWIHGGPTSQWPVDFVPRLALWIDRGWNLLLPDHRGSTGHGRRYQQALHGGWGQLDVEDTATLLAATQAGGAGDPATTVVVGGSAGGMTVLGLVTGAHAKLVAGGIAAYPVTDLVELAERSHRYEAHYTDTLVAPRAPGDPVLRQRSLTAHAGRVARPLLMLHGTEDPVVPFEGTVEFAGAARSAGADVELHLFDGEGHGFTDPANQRREDEVMAAFLARVTGGPAVTDGPG